MRILVAEDEQVLAELIATGLRRAGFAVDTVYSGDAALAYLGLHDYDVVVLDRDLPRVHGDQVARQLVDSGARTRILMLTAATAAEDRVAGLDLGADDYLGKPFDFPELVSRVRALRRRSARLVPPRLERHGIRLDTVRWTADRDGRDLDLSPKEFAVLQILLEADGALISAEELLERAWDAHTDPFTGAVRVCMSKLRSKLGEPSLIRTVQGAGYAL
ncbi:MULTISPECIES: response regulator transcription factor [Streptomyces]|uniref:DNA-binding response regulator n=1 Tax=Streptomyces tsukubensis (strain DSM 42081 / NBRC 108919 / NRRL 18488 / 9993) TaxID=1114943 RepID=I2N2G2_STRT9|nr:MULTISPECIES: response regulator transcription factor [Streptomyces]AZK95326.1 DNA-binding response regulator [Streptomyces tsukubensis]EIF91209.1 two-component system response regulator [Streptomyces tsukubensis NRRL18488]MYS62977.1 response regulator [Streptomyces sp. SID5473]QKM68623.1 DNA-binding response regulator [Streptomyces tsukubensis NRRL18488]TAI43430.1 response regulator transcription factor [Streptomyces tsukubensis]